MILVLYQLAGCPGGLALCGEMHPIENVLPTMTVWIATPTIATFVARTGIPLYCVHFHPYSN